jgi:hypothetical protein
VYERELPMARVRVHAHVPKGANIYAALRERAPVPLLSAADRPRVRAIGRNAPL